MGKHKGDIMTNPYRGVVRGDPDPFDASAVDVQGSRIVLNRDALLSTVAATWLGRPIWDCSTKLQLDIEFWLEVPKRERDRVREVLVSSGRWPSTMHQWDYDTGRGGSMSHQVQHGTCDWLTSVGLEWAPFDPCGMGVVNSSSGDADCGRVVEAVLPRGLVIRMAANEVDIGPLKWAPMFDGDGAVRELRTTASRSMWPWALAGALGLWYLLTKR